MITALHIESYRCIRSLDLTLEPLTALVGPNGSGKSAILSMPTVRGVPSNDTDWPKYFDEYRGSLREAWLSGGLGGVPGAESAG